MIPTFFPPPWFGAHEGGEVWLDLHPKELLEVIRSETDELHAWRGGGLAFGRKAFLAELKRASFRVRPLGFRRDGASTFLVGQFSPSQGGITLTYRFEKPEAFLQMLPLTAAVMILLMGIATFFGASAWQESSQAILSTTAASTFLGLLLASGIIASVLFGLRRDTRRLLAFLSHLESLQPQIRIE